ncbi:hypothetical protein [Streptomyces angustmyceticus]|uniref:hypothetical protein n=1 Tax=Streptomyces angustmyceticus TaxID=285578 RepID=UPI003D8C4BBC
MDFYGQMPTLEETVAWQAVKAAHEIAHHNVGAGPDVCFDDFLDCAVRACGRSIDQSCSRPTVEAASA